MVAKAKRLALCTAIVAGLLMLAGGASPVSAHAGHDHGPPVVAERAPSKAPVAVQLPDKSEMGVNCLVAPIDVASASNRPKAPQPAHQTNCCCGSVACHAGVVAPLTQMSESNIFSERLEPRPEAALSGTIADGIDRPPRESLPL